MAKRKNKYSYLWIVQGNYGYGYGYEDLAASESYKDAYFDLVAYRRNDASGTFRLINRRVLNEGN